MIVKIKFKELQNFCRSSRPSGRYRPPHFFICKMIKRHQDIDNTCCIKNCHIIEKGKK